MNLKVTDTAIVVRLPGWGLSRHRNAIRCFSLFMLFQGRPHRRHIIIRGLSRSWHSLQTNKCSSKAIRSGSGSVPKAYCSKDSSEMCGMASGVATDDTVAIQDKVSQRWYRHQITMGFKWIRQGRVIPNGTIATSITTNNLRAKGTEGIGILFTCTPESEFQTLNVQSAW